MTINQPIVFRITPAIYNKRDNYMAKDYTGEVFCFLHHIFVIHQYSLVSQSVEEGRGSGQWV